MYRSEVVRAPAVSGMFYPDDRDELLAQIDAHLSAAKTQAGLPLQALICPHAGYVYSGPVAGYSYSKLREQVRAGQTFSRVIVMAPAHRVAFRGIAIPNAQAFRTPLGDIPLAAVCSELAKTQPFLLDSRPHAEEHAIEVQLPFLQVVLGTFELVPLVFGAHIATDPVDELCKLATPNTLFVVSTDLSHYLPYEQAVRLDRVTLDHFQSLDADALANAEACGRAPAATMLKVAKKLGLSIELLDYRNSGDTAGDKHRVVGYAALALSRNG